VRKAPGTHALTQVRDRDRIAEEVAEAHGLSVAGEAGQPVSESASQRVSKSARADWAPMDFYLYRPEGGRPERGRPKRGLPPPPF
jgi:hypothetical protein